MNMHIPFESSEHPMLMPIRLPDSEDITGGFQLTKIRRLVGRIRNCDKNVNYGFRTEFRYRCRADMLYLERGCAKSIGNNIRVVLKPLRPIRIVVDNCDVAFFDAAD